MLSLHRSTTKDENGDSKRGVAPLAGVWGCPPSSKNPPKIGGQGVDQTIFEGITGHWIKTSKFTYRNTVKSEAYKR
jgi:hypothetical protein